MVYSKKNNQNKNQLRKIEISQIDTSLLKKKVIIKGLIEKINQTTGPTIFIITDGTGTLSLKGFVSAGKRAYPKISEGDFVEAIVKIEEFNGEIEGDIIKILKLTGESEQRTKKEIEFQQIKRAQVKLSSFMVESEILEKLKDEMINAARQIRLAIIQNRPIVIRHHNDTDGYCAGFSLEKAIIPLIEKNYKSPKAAWEYFKRAPSTAPYYELEDSIKDTATSLRDAAKFSSKMPLIIITDNGSSPQDLMAILQAKVHGSEIIVIDHHEFETDLITKEVKSHINPHLVGEKGSDISAGIICSELARFINEETKDLEVIAALSGLADRIDISNPQLVNKYLELSEKKGYNKELLKDISLVIEFVSTKVKFMEAREYFEVVFGEPRDKQKKLVTLLAPYIKELDKKGLEIGKSSAKIEENNGLTLQTIDIEESYPGFGFFPKPGRSVGLLHDSLQKERNIKKLVSIGIMNTSMTFRATDDANFSMQELIKELQRKLPNAFVEGGGHKNAGSITFIPKMKNEVYLAVRKFLGFL